jgi:hypothetical protein
MDDQNAAPAKLRNKLVHAGRHLCDALRGSVAPVLVPHIADNRRGVRRVPLDCAGLDLPLVGAWLSPLQLPKLEFEGLRGNLRSAHAQ